jgi:hypothetical protein
MKVFIGYDSRQPVAFQVLADSIWRHAYRSVSITRLELSKLPMKRRGLTEFTYSRFLVPYLSDYDGISLFIDSDFLCLGDVYELLAYPAAYLQHDLFVVKNSRRFEWPSLMLFVNEKCKVLTPEYVEDESNSLFDFNWAQSVGELPNSWNHIVNYDPPNAHAKAVHFTEGVPCWPETKDCEYSGPWQLAFRRANSTVSFEDLMGQSVHAARVYNRIANG